jgi:hypothetical protein
VHAAELGPVRQTLQQLLLDLDRSLAPLLRSARHTFITSIETDVRAHEKGHIQGHRYTLTDTASEVPLCASTPLSKLMSATSTTCTASLSLLWQDCMQHMAIARSRAELKLDAGGCEETREGSEEAVKLEAGSVQSVSGPTIDADESGCGNAAQAEQKEYGDIESARRLEVMAQAPNRKWIVGMWAHGSEFLHVDDTATRDRNSLASASRNATGMLATYFPGVLGQ